MANGFDNVESKIGQAGDTLTNNTHLASEAYAEMGALKGRQLGGSQSSESVDRTFGQLTLTGTDEGAHPGRTRRAGEQPMPSPFDLSPEAEARRREEQARRLQDWLQRHGDQRGRLHPH